MHHSRFLTLSAVTLAAAAPLAGALPATAGAKPLSHRIVPFRSVGGVTIGLTPAGVRRVAGTPDRVDRFHGELSDYFYDKKGIEVDFDAFSGPPKVDEVAALARSFRTPQGVHIGSPKSAVKRAFHGIRCDKLSCTARQGKRQTVFLIARNEVLTISVRINPFAPMSLAAHAPLSSVVTGPVRSRADS